MPSPQVNINLQTNQQDLESVDFGIVEELFRSEASSFLTVALLSKCRLIRLAELDFYFDQISLHEFYNTADYEHVFILDRNCHTLLFETGNF